MIAEDYGTQNRKGSTRETSYKEKQLISRTINEKDQRNARFLKSGKIEL